MNRLVILAVIVLVACLLAYAAYAVARRASAEGNGRRAQRRAVAALMVVMIAQLWLWNIRIPDTPSSPGALAFLFGKAGAILMFGIIGVMALSTLVGARPRA